MAANEVIGRMNVFREFIGKSKAEMSRDLRVDAGTFGNILNGKRGIPSELLVRFLQAYSTVSAEWLMRGEGSMLRHSSADLTGSATRLAEGDAIFRLISLLEEKDRQIRALVEAALSHNVQDAR